MPTDDRGDRWSRFVVRVAEMHESIRIVEQVLEPGPTMVEDPKISWPYRVHLREPSFVNVQALPLLVEGGLIFDVIASVGSVDAVMGGCDR